MQSLNASALALADELAHDAETHRVAVMDVAGARVLDCGVQVPGGLNAGLALARICLAGLADVAFVESTSTSPWPWITVRSDHPIRACLASQYAGWQIQTGKFFALGSGPMRAAYGREPIFDHIAGRETSLVAVGVLESRKLPGPEVIAHLGEKLGLESRQLTLLVAPTHSLAGMVQIVARSLETALHKLHELKFPLDSIVSGSGAAPLPPPCPDDLTALGRTNDAILYGGQVRLWVEAEDAVIAQFGPQTPARASRDHGVPFGELFARAGHDFYKLDPMLFAPAEITFHNLRTGRTQRFGQQEPGILRQSFGE